MSVQAAKGERKVDLIGLFSAHLKNVIASTCFGMTVDTEEFFETQQNSSHLKSAIVSGYFGAWANVMKPRESQFGYVELFAGKGRFEDGKESTPVIVARKILADAQLRTKVKTFFNDKDARAIASLQRAIAEIHGSECFLHSPQFSNQSVTPDITEQLPNSAPFPRSSLPTRSVIWASPSVFFSGCCAIRRAKR